MNLATNAAMESPGRRSLPRIYWLEARMELLKVLRMPGYTLPTLTFPLVFYVMFGIVFGKQTAGAISLSTYLLATYGAFGVIGAALFGFGVGLAIERGQGWTLLKRASPMPPGAYFTAKIALSVLFGAVIVLALSALAFLGGDVRMALPTWFALFGILVAGALPFCAFGLAIGSWAGANSAPAVVNLIYLPMAFLSGLWIPIQALPPVIRQIAEWLPAYHLAQLALGTLGADQGGSPGGHVAFLVGFTALSLVVARVGFRRGEDG